MSLPINKKMKLNRGMNKFGVFIVGSTVFTPLTTVIASEEIAITSSTIEIVSIDGSDSIEASENNQLSINLNNTSLDGNYEVIKVSPNVTIINDSGVVLDKYNSVVGEYTVNHEVNEITINEVEAGNLNLIINIEYSLKNTHLTEQSIAVSTSSSTINKTVTLSEIIETEDTLDEDIDTSIQENEDEVSEEIDSSTEEDEDSETVETDEVIMVNDERVEVEDIDKQEDKVIAEDIELEDTSSIEEDIVVEGSQSTEDEIAEDESINYENVEDKEVTDEVNEIINDENSEVIEIEVDNEIVNDESPTEEVEGEITVEVEDNSLSDEVTSEEIPSSVSTVNSLEDDVDTASLASPIAMSLELPNPMMSRGFSSNQQFINDVAPHAMRVAGKNNLYASVMIAQAILESGYGRSTLAGPPNHNLFGIKGYYNGQSVNMPTQEFYNGKYVTINDNFRKYPSYSESFEDNARVIKTTSFYPGTYYYAGAWKENARTYRDATRALTGTYATDPSYNIKLNNLIETHNLTRYDSGGGGSSTSKPNNPITTNTSKPNNSNSNNSKPNNNAKTHTVRSGDTLYGIGLKYGVTVNQLKSWNNLNSNLIHPGDVLKVSGGGTQSTSKPNNSKPNNSKPASKPSNNRPVTTNVSKPNNSSSVHTVRSGDTLYGIGLKYGVTVNQLKSWNNLNSNLIHPGDRLKVSGSGASTSKPSKPVSVNTSSSSNSNVRLYTVKRGDNLYRIAMNNGTTVARLQADNGLVGDMIYIGQVLKIKSGSTSVTSKPVSTTTQYSNKRTYKVRGGDNLYRIAMNNGTTVSSLKAKNGLKGNVIYPGQILSI